MEGSPLHYLRPSTMNFFRIAIASTILFASAAAGAHDFAAYAEASAQLTRLAAETTRLHRMPRASDPAVGKLIATLSDDKRFLGGGAFRTEDLGQMMEMCNAANRADMAYVLFDLGRYVDKSMKDDPARVAAITQKVVVKNILMFQDEVTPLISFAMRCLGQQTILLADFFKALKPEEITPIRLQGLAQMRRGIFSSYIGAATTTTDTAIRMPNRKRMLDAIAEVAPIFSEVLQLPERAQIHDFALNARAKAPPELAAQLQRIIDAMSSKRCEDLCRVSSTAAPAG
jgi:hypothetical protein